MEADEFWTARAEDGLIYIVLIVDGDKVHFPLGAEEALAVSTRLRELALDG